MPIEVELKARITDPGAVVGLLRSWAEGEVSTYADTYYDFPDGRLTQTGRQDPAVDVERLVQRAQRGQRPQVPAPPNPEFHDDTGHVQDHPVEGVHGQEVSDLPPSLVEAEIVGQLLGWDRRLCEQGGQASLSRMFLGAAVRFGAHRRLVDPSMRAFLAVGVAGLRLYR